MTPEQIIALTTLMGRELMPLEMTALEPLLAKNARNDLAITMLINNGQTEVLGSVSTEQVFDTLFSSGDYVALKTAQLAGNALAVMVFSMLEDSKKIGSGRVNFSTSIVRGLLEELAAGGLLTVMGQDALITLATVKSNCYRVDEVSYALNKAEGRQVLDD